MDPVSLYFHIPFCLKRCHYCHFVSTDGRLDAIEAYGQALIREIKLTRQFSGLTLPVHTIYFGGGTPSLIPLSLYEEIFSTIQDNFQVSKDAEISLEVNPGTVDPVYIKGLRQLGFNRISIGIQSIHPQELALLGRIHTAQQIFQTVDWSRSAGFDNINLDLMFALPGQSLTDWKQNLEKVITLQANHLSLYELMIEDGTYLDQLIKQGCLKQTDQDLAADMYEETIDFLASAGYEQYEISNWAARSSGNLMTCRHNMQYWLNQPYLGLGAGACGYISGYRTENDPVLDSFIQSFQENPQREFPRNQATIRLQPVSRWEEIQDTMMLGLRMTRDGISENRFKDRFNRDMESLFSQEIADLNQKGLVEWVGEKGNRSLRLTRQARAIGNLVFMEFIDLPER